MNLPRLRRARTSGFTLIEVLVALAIAGVALAACVRALGLSASGTQAMRERSLALLSAENRMAELRLLNAFPGPGRQTENCPQGPLTLTCEQEIRSSNNTNFRQVTIRVRDAEGTVLADLRGLLSSLR
ncbi:type II secretion system minor pseudopilin GspI [Kerstersia gyiorum]|jgi:general secretion pathway protein I|uniref:Type II secretion system protein I n=1 Tax=Kerstersia gyiorum TaxID=206506 RepID=A0A4Q7MAK2_9BURK|nr:type II secretion system minor pseudopilin GspI [Kerstersia gyiorum]AZV94291.1 type II secretion system protein GspI [Bordetella sp. J329]MCO7638530.1 type II secretion system minor pseudopilin GspI [Pseudomonas sp. S 311-6]KAB0542094.1 type II secretion system protein GspI [Kerstersia gyiorum]MCH4273218.1 type II secretion system minor pseudopilin GspI [Kerstersia gyiorum]MCI1230198.1 type II secretion system minor pseudopilin GspI [Kerstersia gyiorum]